MEQRVCIWGVAVGVFVLFVSIVHAESEKVVYATYHNEALGINIQYPASWYHKISETGDVRQILFSRESVEDPPGKYKVGVQIMQFIEMRKKVPWLDFAIPDKAADQWLNAKLQGSPGNNELVHAERRTLKHHPAYYTEFIMRPEGGYPMRLISLTVFYPDSFSELICEAPEDEYKTVDAICEHILTDGDLTF